MPGESGQGDRRTGVTESARRAIDRAKPTTPKGRGFAVGAVVVGAGGATEVASGSGSATGLPGVASLLFWLLLGAVVAAAVVLAVEE